MFKWRIVLFPFSIIYGFITAIRNFCYTIGVFKSYKIPLKSIVIGNLNVGGTGKSPHVLYIHDLISTLSPKAIISRGYGRTTKGLLEVQQNSSAQMMGDEPLMFKKRLGDEVTVVVSEERKLGVEYVISKEPKSIILLDDAFQHRKIEAGFAVLLTDYSDPFYNDFMLPAGNLREWKSGKNRADCIIVTKCPDELSSEEKSKISSKVGFKNDNVFFSKMIYGELVPFAKIQSDIKKVLLVTGIANPKPLEKWLNRFYEVELMAFQDHHNYTFEELAKIHRKFDTFANKNSAIVTTEKDFVRLDGLLTETDRLNYPWYYQSMTVKIDKEEKFKELINAYVDTI